MTHTEAVFFWIAVWLYGLSFLSYLFSAVFGKARFLIYGRHLMTAGFVLETASMGIRWSSTGHPPVMGTYENSMLGGWFIILLFMVVRRWHGGIEAAGVIIVPAALLIIGNGVMTDTAHMPLAPPYKSNWLWLHVFFAWAAYGAFLVAAGIGVIYLLKEKAVRSSGVQESGSPGFYRRLPELNVLNDLILKTVIFGFIALTVEIGAGAIWAYGLWGRYWGWDPIETWSFITWLVYGTYIHLGVTLGWKGRRMAWLAIFALLSEFITFGGIGYLGGVHTTIL